MKLVRNAGADRVIDLIRPSLRSGSRLDVVTPVLSLFAFAELLPLVASLAQCRFLLPPTNDDLAVLGSVADRSARNQLQTRWLAKRLVRWLEETTEVRRAVGWCRRRLRRSRRIGSGSAALLGSLAFSTDGLGLTPGNPLSLIQASETPEEAQLLSLWFDAQWSALAADSRGRPH